MRRIYIYISIGLVKTGHLIFFVFYYQVDFLKKNKFNKPENAVTDMTHFVHMVNSLLN